MSRGIGYLQQELIKQTLKNNRITLYYAKELYGSKTAAKSALLKLQAMEYIVPSAVGEWKPTDKAKEVLENEME